MNKKDRLFLEESALKIAIPGDGRIRSRSQEEIKNRHTRPRGQESAIAPSDRDIGHVIQTLAI